MIEYGPKFRLKAQEIIKKFTQEQGKGKLIHVLDTGYDPEEGEIISPSTAEEEVYIAFSDIDNSYGASDYGAEYLRENMLAMIAGDDLAVIPKAGDYVQRPGSTKKHKIIAAPTDMYGAMYSCHVVRKAEVELE